MRLLLLLGVGIAAGAWGYAWADVEGFDWFVIVFVGPYVFGRFAMRRIFRGER